MLPQRALSAVFALVLGGCGPGLEEGPRPVVPGSWVTIGPGSFVMGSATDERCRSANETQHRVTLTDRFEMSATEVTREEYQRVMGYDPSTFSCGPTCPVENVTWHEAAGYCNGLSRINRLPPCYLCQGERAQANCVESVESRAGSCLGYRLPTEAEWEYAYRAGQKTAYYVGVYSGGPCQSTERDPNLDPIAWYTANASGTVHPVGEKTPNAFGLFDMAGNTMEWVSDWYQDDLGTTEATNPAGPLTATERTLRGGSWATLARQCRASSRFHSPPSHTDNDTGFRCARRVTP